MLEEIGGVDKCAVENADKQWLTTCIIGIDALCYFGYDCGNLLLGQVLIKDEIVDGDTLHGMKNILN